MAPTTAGCCPMMQSTQAVEAPTVEVGSGRRRLSLDSWVCLPILRPVRTASSSSSSSSSSSTGSSCTTTTTTATLVVAQKDLPKPTMTLEVVAEDEALTRDSGCETPKSKEHRIPDVDVGFCPPAPRKPRAMARRRRVQPTSFFNTPDFENFLSQHKLQVGS